MRKDKPRLPQLPPAQLSLEQLAQQHRKAIENLERARAAITRKHADSEREIVHRRAAIERQIAAHREALRRIEKSDQPRP